MQQEITKTGKILEVVLAIIFVIVGVALRLMPHPPNFSPIMAMALFSGVYLSKKVSFVLPIIAMAISDIFLGFYDLKLLLVVYFGVILCVALGVLLKNHKNWKAIAASSISGSAVFFIITNFAVWFFYEWYPKTFSGLLACYTEALPFFKNSLSGDLFFTAVFFGAYGLARFLIQKKFVFKKSIIGNNI